MVNNKVKMMAALKAAVITAIFLISSCVPAESTSIVDNVITPIVPTLVPAPTSSRSGYAPGELVDYIAQAGDTLPALAERFNTTVGEIRQANPIIPLDATTMPAGLPMKIPIYFLPLWGTEFKSISDSAFINGPSQIGFSTSAFVAETDGWWKDYRAFAGGEMRSGAKVIDYVATNYSISPRLLLAILEYQTGALTRPDAPDEKYMLGLRRVYYESPYLQIVVAANLLNNGYYSWREGSLTEFELVDKTIFRPDPWQNAGSVAIQYYYSTIYSGMDYHASIGPDGLAHTYQTLFGDSWLDSEALIPGSLQQPALRFPFQAGQAWSFTGGPHAGWGSGEPFAALDFAPPSNETGCVVPQVDQFVISVSDGTVIRSNLDGVIIDLDNDGDERTGWVIFYLHLATEGRVQAGQAVKAGDRIGYPSCEGGSSTGTHVHIARKYNGEWMLASGTLAFNLEGWVAQGGSRAYAGSLTRGPLTVTACECGDSGTLVKSEAR